MDQFPSAVLLARLEDVKINNNVLYRLVRPTETGTQVESVDKMVNVVPFRRLVISMQSMLSLLNINFKISARVNNLPSKLRTTAICYFFQI